MMKKCVLVLLFVSYVCFSNGQVFTPIIREDSNWQLTTSDDFNSFNSTFWNRVPLNNKTWGLETYNANNVNASNGVLTLTCQKQGNQYISGAIVSKNKFQYGYFEIDIQFPQKGIQGPWGGWWLQSGGSTYSELDMVEPSGCQTRNGYIFSSGGNKQGSRPPASAGFLIDQTCESGSEDCSFVCRSYNTSTQACVQSRNICPGGTSLDLSAGFNTYSLLWLPNMERMYFNGQFLFEESLVVPYQCMHMYLTFQIDPGGCQPNSTATFPLTWKYRKLRHYTLKTDCNTAVTQDNFNFLAFNYKVKKSYSIGNSIVPNSANVYFWATDYIELRAGFEVPVGCSFTANVLGSCPTCTE